MSDQTVSIASVLLGAGYQWDEGKVIADRLAALEYQDRFRLAAFIVGEPEAATPPALDVETLAVVGAARRFLTAHDRVIASDPTTRDDTFAMKNAADDLRDVIAFYDDSALKGGET